MVKRDGRGRPVVLEQERLLPIPMRLESAAMDEACRKARAAGRSLAAELRRLVHKALAMERGAA